MGQWKPGDPLAASTQEMLDYFKEKHIKPVAYVSNRMDNGNYCWQSSAVLSLLLPAGLSNPRFPGRYDAWWWRPELDHARHVHE
eukprot:SAG31_NODE_371_length_16628_cov_3.741943_16_plen_84_part_00